MTARATRWTTKRIAFAAILIAISVSMTVLLIKIFPLFSVPTFKQAIIGIPVKITGYLFGAMLGTLVAIMADLISFMFAPTFYHPLYTTSLVIAACTAGIIARLYHRISARTYHHYDLQELQASYERLIPDTRPACRLARRIAHLSALPPTQRIQLRNRRLLARTMSTTILCVILGILTTMMLLLRLSQSSLNRSMFHSRAVFGLFISIGLISMLVCLIILWILLAYTPLRRYQAQLLYYMPIIAFSAMIDFLANYLVSWGDHVVFGSNFYDLLISHSIVSPIKIWINFTVISISVSVLEPILRRHNWSTPC